MFKYKGFLSGNVIKIIAAVAMLIDHFGVLFESVIGYELYVLSRSIGRLAFPIFAYFIAEGCRYTKDKKNYFWKLFLLGLVCNCVYYVAMDEIYSCVLTTFSASVLLIYSYDGIVKSLRKKDGLLLFRVIQFAAVVAVTLAIIKLTESLGGLFDYGFAGAILPLFAYVFKNRWLKLAAFTVGLFGITLSPAFTFLNFQFQWFAFVSVGILALYTGERGKYKMKNFFYLFYPIHLVALEGVYLLLYLLGAL